MHFFMIRICTFQQMWNLKLISYVDSFSAQNLFPFGMWQVGRGSKNKYDKVWHGGRRGQKYRFSKWHDFLMYPNIFFLIYSWYSFTHPWSKSHKGDRVKTSPSFMLCAKQAQFLDQHQYLILDCNYSCSYSQSSWYFAEFLFVESWIKSCIPCIVSAFYHLCFWH